MIRYHRLLVLALIAMLYFPRVSSAFGQGRTALPVAAEFNTPKSVQKSYFNGSSGLFVPEWEVDGFATDLENPINRYAAPVFKMAQFDADVPNLPYYDLVVPVGKLERVEVNSAIGNNVEETSTSMFNKSIKGAKIDANTFWYPASHVVSGQILTVRGEDFQHVRIYPILVSSDGGRIRKAESVSYSIRKRQDANRKAATYTGRMGYVANSVLESGDWYKVGVNSEGIFQLDYNFFNSLGVDPSTIDPRTVKVYGNGGAALPQVAGTYPYDDLVENAVLAQGEGDGSLDPGDYFAFYCAGLGEWKDNARVDRYIYFPNFYSDTTFYFVTWGNGNGMRIPTVPSASNPNFTPTYTTKFARHELERDNTITSGRLWIGERFDLTTRQNFSFSIPNILPNSFAKAAIRVAATSVGASSKFSISEDGVLQGEIPISPTSDAYGSIDYQGSNRVLSIPSSRAADGNFNFELEYSKPTTSSVGYLDFIELEFQQELNAGFLPYYYFTATDFVGTGQVFDYRIANMSSSHAIWDVTNPLNVRAIAGTLNGTDYNFAVEADSNKRFVAFTSAGFKKPISVKSIPNQNLHALPQAEFIIITPRVLKSAADKLAEFHRSEYGQSVNVVELPLIFNEFSSGAQDPTAIRDFLKMFYDRSLSGGTQLRYALLFGDGSYDYKYIKTPPGSNLIPTYQSRRSQLPTQSYTSDDYYGFLDDGEGHWGEQSYNRDGETIPLFLAEGDTNLTDHGLDIGIGRFPVGNLQEAEVMVAKIIGYHTDYSGFGSWRNRVVLVGDHKDSEGNIHSVQADGYTGQIENANPCINIDKIYMDNYVMENQASGDRFPEGKEALLNALDEGSLLVNYTGHGGEVAWSNASILDISDINKIANGFRLPAYITATCEFGRWDDPSRRSGAETLFLREGGGAIAMFTTVRVVFSGPNHTLNINYYNEVFKWDALNNRMPTMGEVFYRTKNVSWGGSINNRNFSLLGDPAMQLAYPKNKAVITNINGIAVQDTVVDTLRSLNLITIQGEVRDQQDVFLPNFNGDLAITVYDRPSKFTTRRRPFDFIWQKNRIFKGSATVQNGRFSFQFVVPVDISYEDNLPNLHGKISLYFNDAQTDGGGCNTNIFIGGSDSTTISDKKAPELSLFMNDIKFADGGLVGPDPVLLAEVFDENGINTVGTGIGHELTAVLDGNESKVIILNDYYQANKNSYQDGTISYPFKDLDAGDHHLRVKVWDVANNSAESEINFVVADDATMALGHVLNYPNPFTSNTKFFIEHNKNGNLLNVTVKIYTVSGKVVKTLDDTFFANGNLYCDLEWDGLDDYGDAIGRGVYVYQVTVKDETSGERISKFEKLVLLR